MNSLESLHLSSNSLRHIPSDAFTNTTSLEFLDLQDNRLESSMKKSIQNLCWLKTLWLSNNNFSDQLSDWIQQLRCAQNSIEGLGFTGNPFGSGPFPDFSRFSKVVTLVLQNTSLHGSIPQSFGHLPYLTFHNLIGLRLQANKLQRSIPTSLCNLPDLQILDLSINNITGNIPNCFGNLSAMSNLTTRSRAIFYRVAGDFSELSFMDTVTLSWKGEDVECSKILGLMKTIDLSCNYLTGEIPSGITTLVALASLNLSRNNLKGPIPFNMGQMERLESLDLSRNSLSGEIPISFSNLSFLSVLNLSFNNLSGKIPTATQLQTFDASSYKGNQGFCGPPLTEGCLNPNPQNIDAGGEDNLISFGFYVSMALGFIVGFLGVCGTLILKSSWMRSFFHFFEYIMTGFLLKLLF